MEPIDIHLLQLMKNRDTFYKLKSVVNHDAIDKKTRHVLGLFKEFFEADPDCKEIPVNGEFGSWFFVKNHKLKDETKELYRQLLPRIAEPASELAEATILPRLVDLDLAYRAGLAIDQYQQGEEVDLYRVIKGLHEEAETLVKTKIQGSLVSDDDLFNDAVNDRGFGWRWDCLAGNMRKLRGGDFGVLAARPDQGKTSALCDLATYWATQLPDIYPGEFRPILWLNNEGPGRRIRERMVSAALEKPSSVLVELANANALWPAFERAIGGPANILQVHDIHGWRNWQVEELLRRVRPGLVIFDMIDNIRFEGEVGNGGTRTDQILEAMYQWARDLAVIMDVPCLATSQLSADAEGVPYPALANLKDSKTGKQGACDFIITMGTSLEPGLEQVRFIGQTKNKLQLEGSPKSCKSRMILSPHTGRFTEYQ